RAVRHDMEPAEDRRPPQLQSGSAAARARQRQAVRRDDRRQRSPWRSRQHPDVLRSRYRSEEGGRAVRRGAAAVLVALSIACAATTIARAQTTSCQSCVEARFWEVSPTFWSSTASDGPSLPESALLDELKKADVGVAFSG